MLLTSLLRGVLKLNLIKSNICNWQGRWVKNLAWKELHLSTLIAFWNLDVYIYIYMYVYIKLLSFVQMHLLLHNWNCCADATSCLRIRKADLGLMLWQHRTHRIKQPCPLSKPRYCLLWSRSCAPYY